MNFSARWGLERMAGRLVEFSGNFDGAVLTAAAGVVLEAQEQREPVVWLCDSQNSFYPPDLEASGIDLEGLVVVQAAHEREAARAAARLLYSGGFGLVVLDLASYDTRRSLPMPLMARLMGLARKHHAIALMLTRKEARAPSLGSLISLRAEVRRVDCPESGVIVDVLKDKRGGPRQKYFQACRPPDGLRYSALPVASDHLREAARLARLPSRCDRLRAADGPVASGQPGRPGTGASAGHAVFRGPWPGSGPASDSGGRGGASTGTATPAGHSASILPRG